MRARQTEGMSPFSSASVPAHQMDTVRVFLYARQSKARQDESETSTTAQLSAGRALSESRSLSSGVQWTVVGEFADVGRSGWDPKIVRAEFEEMMTRVRAGEADAVIVQDLARLTRKGAHDALEIDKEFQAHGVRFVSVLEPFLDTSTPIGLAIFALIAALAKQDSDTKAERLVNAKGEIKALGGRPSGEPPYGMRSVRTQAGKLTITTLEPDDDNPSHVETVRRMAGMSMEGTSDNRIAAILSEEQIPPPGAAKRRATERRKAAAKARRVDADDDSPMVWRAQTVRMILTHPAIGGFGVQRVKRGKATINVVSRSEAGVPLTPHRGILEGKDWMALQERRKRPSRPELQPGRDIEPALLSGWRILTCGLCGGALGQDAESYRCGAPRGHGGLGIKRVAADEAVARRVWARLSSADPEDPDDRGLLAVAAKRFAEQQDLAGAQEERRDTSTHLAHVRRSIAELQADRKAGLYRGGSELDMWRATIQQYRQYEDQCVARLAELDDAQNAAIRVPEEWFMGGSDPLGPGTPWSTWDVFERREFLDLFLTGVVVGLGRDPDTRKVIPAEDRIEILWRAYPREDDSGIEETTPALIV